MSIRIVGKTRVKFRKLDRLLRSLPGAVVAFSGGVDSSVLLKAARDALGTRVLAVTARSPLYSAKETALARKIARQIGVRHLVYESHEMEMPQFRKNPRDRCYYCKWELFTFMKRIAAKLGYDVIEGGNRSDLGDYRPGRTAARKLRIRSPLAEAGFEKSEIRTIARSIELPNWDKPATPCLASRIPYGRTVDKETLDRIGRAETYLKRLKLTQVRVRDHLPVARIEVRSGEFYRVLRHRKRIAGFFRKLGYKYAALDLQGYQTGSLNL